MGTATVPAPAFQPLIMPAWVDRILLAFVVYVVFGSLWMLSGTGGPHVTFYVGLSYKLPAELACIAVVL